MAFGGSNFLVTWGDFANFAYDIVGTFVSPSGTVPDPDGFPISTAPGVQQVPNVAFHGGNYLVVWDDERNSDVTGVTDIYGARVNGGGTVLDPAGIPISVAPDRQSGAGVAVNGGFLVTWTDRRRGQDFDVFASRLDPDGTVAHPQGFAVTGAPTEENGSAVAPGRGAGNYAVVYQRFAGEAPYGTNRAFLRQVTPK